jgi:WhiB family transcriptional regulator, redox-sensing transcriptional regulator
VKPNDTWMQRAACKGMTNLFYSEHHTDIARARAICSTCPVRSQCLERAIERREVYGVWGGRIMSASRLARLRRERAVANT